MWKLFEAFSLLLLALFHEPLPFLIIFFFITFRCCQKKSWGMVGHENKTLKINQLFSICPDLRHVENCSNFIAFTLMNEDTRIYSQQKLCRFRFSNSMITAIIAMNEMDFYYQLLRCCREQGNLKYWFRYLFFPSRIILWFISCWPIYVRTIKHFIASVHFQSKLIFGRLKWFFNSYH